jgi:hypothetical protein
VSTASTLEATPPDTRRPRVERFALILGAIVVAGLIVRVLFVLIARGSDFELRGDDFYYHWQARALADGHWFIEPLVWRALGRFDPTAGHPPMYTLYLGFWSFVGLATPVWHRLVSCLLGAAMVALCGLAGRRIAGDRAGLLAAAAGAVYPALWINDGMLVSESMYQLLIAGVLLTAYRLWQQPSRGNAAWLGAAIALASLTRPEAVLLFPLIGVPFLVKGTPETKRRVQMCLVGGAVGAALIAPWLVRNLTIFDKPVTLASGSGTVAQGANCDSTYYGNLVGYWDPRCIIAARPPKTPEEKRLLKERNGVPGFSYLIADPNRDESVEDEKARSQSWDYISSHLGRAPVVALARLGRIYEVYRPTQNVQLDDFFERRGKWPSRLGLAGYYVLFVLSVVGIFAMRKRRVPISPIIAIVVMVTFTTALAIGLTRYRSGLDVALAVVGGVGADAIWRRLADRRRRSTEPTEAAS